MNSIITIIESKIKNFKVGEDYKLINELEKKTYTIFNKELKEIFWELFPQFVAKNLDSRRNSNFNHNRGVYLFNQKKKIND